MNIEQAIKEYNEAISDGNYAFIECCLEVTIRQAKEHQEGKLENIALEAGKGSE